MKMGSTRGVSACIIARTCRPTRAYVSMSGRSTTAPGQARSAWNIGRAACAPKVRAMPQAVDATPRRPPPTMSGRPRRAGPSRVPTAA
ncbi:hypothetical protein OPKNFCMD_4983 [Methylobacterium crusticola]|uniref:Uncharacterized protein n=1 Tax=Methylobacterium crusticola TaxID=1697972 RepID=A0ABQ4R5Y4_9HYPH|nr:hypothetical protein OPKNFCMD_4983 [Methylobacterium crusticola]